MVYQAYFRKELTHELWIQLNQNNLFFDSIDRDRKTDLMKDHLKAYVLNDLNQPTGEILNLDFDRIYSPICACGQKRIICQMVNRKCDKYVCVNLFDCPGTGQFKISPRDLKKPEKCEFCGDQMKKYT